MHGIERIENTDDVDNEMAKEALNAEVLDRGSFYVVLCALDIRTRNKDLSINGSGQQLEVTFDYGQQKDAEYLTPHDHFIVRFDEPIEDIHFLGKIDESSPEHLDNEQQFSLRMVDSKRSTGQVIVGYTLRMTVPKKEVSQAVDHAQKEAQ